MKQVLQNRKSGELTVADVPPPVLQPEGILLRSRTSLISAGTERAALELGQKSMVGMARERPDLVQRVLDKLKRDGFWATLNTVQDQLDRDVPMGYSACGEVIEVGSRAQRFQPGQIVAAAGAGSANHAQFNYVPSLLAVPVPDGVTTEQAAYATVGAIALQGVRNADVRVGESVVVVGLGLVGLLAVQLLRAAGCRVIGLDLSPMRVALAQEHGAEAAFISRGSDFEASVMDVTRGHGADAVLITAATKSNEPVELAARLARDRARIVMVGVTGMDLPRNDYYHKELSFIVSRSYGPGRYDLAYEEQGHDYPIGHVRWTENRNLEAFLDLTANGSIRPEVCTTHRFSIDEAEDAYRLILAGTDPHLGVLLDYPATAATPQSGRRITLRAATAAPVTGSVGVSFIGAGNFARGTLLKYLKRLGDVQFRGVMTSSGLSAKSAGEKFGFDYCTSSIDELLCDDRTDAVFITTRHSAHAALVCDALRQGKTVFVEKPLAVDEDQLADVVTALEEHAARLMVGYNRRFAPLAVAMKEQLGDGPMSLTYRCNAGRLPQDHWLAVPEEGGRIMGEACHFVDLCQYLIGSAPQSVFATGGRDEPDNLQMLITFENGSTAHIAYVTEGATGLSKERIEGHAGGRSAVLDDFRRLDLFAGRSKTTKKSGLGQDKGHAAQLTAFVESLRSGGPLPIEVSSLIDTSRVTLAALRSLQTGAAVTLDSSFRSGSSNCETMNL